MAKKALLLRIGLQLDEFPETQPLLMDYITCPIFAHAATLPTLKEMAEYRLDHAYVEAKDGVPLVYYRPGKIQQRLYHKYVLKNDLGRLGGAMLSTIEWIRRDAVYHHTRTGMPSRLSFAFDLQDFAVSNLVSPFTVLSVSRLTFPIMTTCFPDLVHRLILYNVSTPFLVFWERLVKPFLSESIKQKLVIIGKGAQCYKEMKKYLPDESIPAYLGGSLTGKLPPYEDDPFCRDRIGAVGPYLPDKGLSLMIKAGMDHVDEAAALAKVDEEHEQALLNEYGADSTES